MEEVARLRELTRILREPGGCDWDRAQDLRSMRPHLVEEAYEVIDAIDRENLNDLREELGDVLFLVHFFARLAEEQGAFDLEAVARSINEKLIRRHPHVFADVQVSGVADILRNWEEIKRREQGTIGSEEGSDHDEAAPLPDSILRKAEESLPALFRAVKIQEKVSRVGFDWPAPEGVLEKIQEESRELLSEWENAANPAEVRATRIEEELGDLLFSVVNLARHLGANPELALQRAVDRFVGRFRKMERILAREGRVVAETSASDLDRAWNEAKGRTPTV